MKTKKPVAMKVNQENLVQSLKFSFTNRSTVLGELMQNARRAGASQVSFYFDATSSTLRVSDDGCGIDDIEALLTVAESGWDEGLMQAEHPFGLGFLSALYACEHLTLVSKCGRLRALTADILAFKGLDVDASVDWAGVTTLTLKGFGLDAAQVEDKLKTLAEGFPIPVLLNGISLERPAAFDVAAGCSPSGLAFVETEIGWVFLRSHEDSEVPREYANIRVYLQGLPIYGSAFSFDSAHFHLIHLNSACFFARLPDRDKLVDEKEVVSLIHEVLNHVVRQRLVALKASMAPEAFAETFDTLRFWKCLDLLNDVDYLPAKSVEAITDYPNCDSDVFGWYTNHPGQAIARSAIESGEVEVVTIDDHIKTDGAQRFMFAWLRDSLLYQGNLDEGHWLHPMIRHLNDEEATVELVNESHSATFCGSWVWLGVTFCEAYRIKVGSDVVLVTDHAFYEGDDQGETIVMPQGERSPAVISQAATFKSEYDDYQQATHDADCEAFYSFIVANTAHDPAVAMGQLLPEFTGCPLLYGKAFVVSLDEIGKVASVLAA